MKFALIALLGFAASRSLIQESSESSSSDNEDVQLGGVFRPEQSGRQVDGYVRVVPDRFSGNDDDLFMRSMISNYALEGQDKDGAPTGVFSMDQTQAKAAAKEVLKEHKKLEGEALDTYLNTYFEKAWGHFDVNRTGSIEVIKMPQFIRFLASDQYMQL